MPDEIDEILKFDPGKQATAPPVQDDEIDAILKFDPGPGETAVEPTQPDQQPPAAGDDNKLSWKQAIIDAVGNIPESAEQFGKDIIQPIIHPVKTAKTIGRLATGAIEKIPGAAYLTPGPAYDIEGEPPRSAEIDAMVDFFSDRYGSVDNFKKSVAKDPVGVLADVATLVTGAGGLVKGTGKVASMVPKLGGVGKAIEKTGEVISKTGAATEPINISKAAASLPTKVMSKKIPQNMYLSSAKFGTTIPRAERVKMASLALDNEIMPTVRGLDKLRNQIDGLNTEITNKIDAAVTSGEKIPIDELFKDFDSLKREFSLSGRPIKNWKAIDGIKADIKQANEILKRKDLTPAEAQKLKQKIYKELETHYSAVKESPAAVQAQKAVARAAKEAIEDIIPEVKYLNKTEGDLIQLRHSIEKSAARISNRDIIGIGTPIKATMGGVTGGYGGAIAGTVLGILDTPTVKARIANVLNRLKKKGIKVDPKAVAARMATYQAGRAEEITGE